MPDPVTFQIPVGSGTVRGMLRGVEEDRRRPAVLLASGLPGAPDAASGLLEALGAALEQAGIASARYEPRGDDRADGLVDDASAVLRWMLLRESVDPLRAGLFGFGTGAIVAACLAARTDQVNRLCLLAPTTSEEVLARLARPNGLSPLVDRERIGTTLIATLDQLEPARDVARRDRATLVVHGAADRVIPPDSARPYLDAIELAGRVVDHELIALADHELTAPEARAVGFARIVGFFAGMTPLPAGAPA